MSDVAEYDDSYPSCDQTHAVFRVYSGEMSPRDVSAQLGLEPTQVNERGTTRVSTAGRTRTVPLNAWFLSSEGHVESKDLRRHLDWLLDRIEPAAVPLAALKKQMGVRMWIHCSWWSATGNGGPTLSPNQMGRMAALGLECGFEVLFLSDDD